MNWALLIIYILMAISLLIASNKHGQLRSDYNFWIVLIASLIDLLLIWWAVGWRFI